MTMLSVSPEDLETFVERVKQRFFPSLKIQSSQEIASQGYRDSRYVYLRLYAYRLAWSIP